MCRRHCVILGSTRIKYNLATVVSGLEMHLAYFLAFDDRWCPRVQGAAPHLPRSYRQLEAPATI